MQPSACYVNDWNCFKIIFGPFDFDSRQLSGNVALKSLTSCGNLSVTIGLCEKISTVNKVKGPLMQ